MFIQFRKKTTQARGTSSLEYMILVAAIVSLLVAFLGPTGIFNKAMTRMYGMSADGMTDMASRLSQSLTPSTTTPDDGAGAGLPCTDCGY